LAYPGFLEVAVSREEKRQEAMELVGKAYQHHMKGEIEKAIELYNQSITACPTAEAFTFRGWARSYQPEPDFDEAIADCHRAIDLDPEFGNPYNDIGAYYIELNQPEDAIPWLRMALKAKRYESYCFPYFNLGRIYEAQGNLDRALEHYRAALNENPGYVLAAKAVERVKTRLGTAKPCEA
jgi:tetratricopeptide (TPR) repeat protein